MCRMLVFRSNRARRVADLLVESPHSLQRQSCRDRRGEQHGDGWGIAAYAGERPTVVRRPTSAVEDAEYARAAAQVEAPLVIGHVRQASVGATSAANCHPFTWGRWTFAHNGTLQAFAEVRPRLIAETSACLASARQGDTDSECVFLWLLSGLAQDGIDLEGEAPGVESLVRLFRTAIPRLAGWSDAENPPEPSRLNLVLTDGRALAVSRWGHSLWRRQADNSGAREAIAASEPVDGVGEGWDEVPDRAILAVDDQVRSSIHPI